MDYQVKYIVVNRKPYLWAVVKQLADGSLVRHECYATKEVADLRCYKLNNKIIQADLFE